MVTISYSISNRFSTTSQWFKGRLSFQLLVFPAPINEILTVVFFGYVIWLLEIIPLVHQHWLKTLKYVWNTLIVIVMDGVIFAKKAPKIDHDPSPFKSLSLHRKWKNLKMKNIIPWGIRLRRGTCFSKYKNVFIFPFSNF